MTLPAYALQKLGFPEMYERLLVGPLFRPWGEVLLSRAALKPGERVLDAACGTGIVARDSGTCGWRRCPGPFSSRMGPPSCA